MRDVIKNLFMNEIILEDNSIFYYTIKPYELANSIGTIITILKEYSFIKKDNTSTPFCCKLYRTKEGNWYDIEEINTGVKKGLLTALKLVIDEKEEIFKELIIL
jgi:hypothetical protein